MKITSRIYLHKTFVVFLICLLTRVVPLSAETNPAYQILGTFQQSTQFKLQIEPIDCYLSPQVLDQIQKGAHFLYGVFHQQFGLEFPASLEFRVKLFARHAAYKEYQRKVSGADSDYGFYVPRLNEAVIVFQSNEALMKQIILHEIVHAFINQWHPFIPRWLNEGMAMYFETLQIQNEKVIIQPHAGAAFYLAQEITMNRLTNVRRFLEISTEWEEYHKGNVGGPYAYAWSITFFLMSSRERQNYFKYFLTVMKQNQRGKDFSSEAMNVSYPGGIQKFEQDWHAWLMKKPEPHEFILRR